MVRCESRLIIVLALVVSGGGCAENDADSGLPGSDTGPLGVLRVAPEGPVEVGFSDTVAFDVVLETEDGQPISGAPVDAAFLDQSRNAELTPSRFITDELGRGSVLFTAPSPTSDDKITFEIRFRSPESERRVEITVDPSLVAVSVQVDYQGAREISNLEAVLYLTDEESGVRTRIARREIKAILPAEVTFSGLLRESRYEVEVNGRNTSDQIRAAGRLLNVAPNTDNLTLILEDTKLNPAAAYDVEMIFTTEGSLDWSVDALLSAADLIHEPASAILDGTAAELDAFAAELFSEQREAQSLDTALAEFLEDAGADVQGGFDDVRRLMLEALSRTAATGRVEIGRTEDLGYTVYHALDQLTFGMDREVPGPTFPIVPAGTAEGTLSLGEGDTLAFSQYEFTVGLGDAVGFLFAETVEDVFARRDMLTILQSMVRCEEVALFLEPRLQDVTVRTVIEQGCAAALETAVAELEGASTPINAVDRMVFDEAAFVLEIPDIGSEIPGFSADALPVRWAAEGEEGNLFPAAFVARVSEGE